MYRANDFRAILGEKPLSLLSRGKKCNLLHMRTCCSSGRFNFRAQTHKGFCSQLQDNLNDYLLHIY